MNTGLQSRPQTQSWTSATCEDSFAFFSKTPLVVQRPRDHRLVIVLPVRRECCSWSCGSSARATYFTAATNTNIQQAQPGVDFVEARGTVIFEVGQQRAQLAVEILPGLTENSTSQRAFAVVLEDPMKAARASTDINIEPTHAASIPPAWTVNISTYSEVLILSAVGVLMLVAWWIREKRCRLPRRGRAFQYKVLLLSRRNSGASHEMSEALRCSGDNPGKKSGVRRTPRHVSSFWKAMIMERRKSEAAVAEGKEVADKRMALLKDTDEDCEAAGGQSDSERDLKQHLASIQLGRPL